MKEYHGFKNCGNWYKGNIHSHTTVSEDVYKRQLQEWKGHFNSAVEEGIKVGVTAGEMKEMIDTACRNHAMERGESND